MTKRRMKRFWWIVEVAVDETCLLLGSLAAEGCWGCCPRFGAISSCPWAGGGLDCAWDGFRFICAKPAAALLCAPDIASYPTSSNPGTFPPFCACGTFPPIFSDEAGGFMCNILNCCWLNPIPLVCIRLSVNIGCALATFLSMLSASHSGTSPSAIFAEPWFTAKSLTLLEAPDSPLLCCCCEIRLYSGGSKYASCPAWGDPGGEIPCACGGGRFAPGLG